MPSTRILKMSFLRENFKESTNKIQVSSPTKSMPSGYEAVDTMVHLTPSPRPMSTSTYDHNSHVEQKDICSRLQEEEPSLFSQRDTIMKMVANERQYKQRQQFDSKVSVESLCDVLEKNGLVLKCTFVRPGFSASNTCLMASPEHLREAMKSEGDDFNLKKVRLALESDSALSPENGSMYVSLIQKANGNHMLYSLDYHVAEQHDKKLFCE